MKILLFTVLFLLCRILLQRMFSLYLFRNFPNKYSISNQIISLFYLCLISYYESLIYKDIVPLALNYNSKHLYPKKLEYFYVIQIAFHVQSVLLQPKNELSMEIWLHHFITIVLLFGSWYHNFLLHGFVVLYLHDISDIPMFMIRLTRSLDGSNYSNKQEYVCTTILQIALVPILIVIWFYYRIYLFGIYNYNLNTIYFSNHENSEFIEKIMCSCLGILLCLNNYWFSLIIQKTFKFIKY